MEHQNTHTGSKPFICNVCNTGFASRSNLRVHRRIHDRKDLPEQQDTVTYTYSSGAASIKARTPLVIKPLGGAQTISTGDFPVGSSTAAADGNYSDIWQVFQSMTDTGQSADPTTDATLLQDFVVYLPPEKSS